MAGRDTNNKKHHVCRVLFREDTYETEVENSLRLMEEELASKSEESKVKWNFDFSNEVPLEGDWEWEKVENGGEYVDEKEDNNKN